MVVVLKNIAEEETTVVTGPPLGLTKPHKFEMLYDGFTRRGYADTTDELLNLLIPGYDRATKASQLARRLYFAVKAQALVQAHINHMNDLSKVTHEEAVVLDSDRTNPPDISRWDCEVPIVLVDTYYAPFGSKPRPFSGIADVLYPPNILWISPLDPHEFLRSLHRIGFIALFTHADYRE